MTQSFNNKAVAFEPLTSPTETRLIILAPGSKKDPIHCCHLTIDLDWDWDWQGERPRTWSPPKFIAESYIQLATGADEDNDDDDEPPKQGFYVPNVRSDWGQRNRGVYPFQKYTALSHGWAAASGTPQKIMLNGEEFYVGEELHRALKQLRGDTGRNSKTAYGQLLWIDALCVSQSDCSEREQQALLMGRVYRQAEKVYTRLDFEGGKVGPPSTKKMDFKKGFLKSLYL